MQNTPPPVPPSLPASAATAQPGALSVWSLVLGIVSLLCFGPLAGIPAIITGHMARSRSNNDGKALAGLILGYISIALLPIYAAIALPAFQVARTRAIETACLNNIRQLEGAKELYAADTGKPAASLEDLVPKYLRQSPVCHKAGEYTIGGKDENPTCSFHGDLIANPPGSKRTPSRGIVEEPVEK